MQSLKNSELFLFVLLILMMLNCCHAIGFGRCPKYPSMPKFNLTRVLGQWYEVERSFYLPEIASGCTKLSFHTDSEAPRFSEIYRIEVAIKTINRFTGSPSISIGYATPESNRSSIMDFKFSSRLPDVIVRLLPGSGKYQVLFTDYENFAILWSCSSLGPIGHADQIWVFGRDRDFSADVRAKIYEALQKLALDPNRLVISKNKNCPNAL